MASIVDSLNKDPEEMFLQDYESPVGRDLHAKFNLFLENDKKVYNYFKSVPGIWECRWFNDKNQPGYDAGEFFWLNIYPIKEFIGTFHTRIKEYIDIVASRPMPTYDNTQETFDIYYNALTGYTEANHPEPYQRLFDIGDNTKRIQLAVSLYDNNKEPMDNTEYWKKFFVNEEWMLKELSTTIDKAVEQAIEDHIKYYHLNGMTKKTANVDRFMNLDYDNALSSNTITTVKQYLRKPYYLSNDVEKNTATYCAYREWTNGTLEHFGTICTDDKRFNDGNYITIPLDWNIIDSNTPALTQKELANGMNNVLSVNEANEDHVIGPQDDALNLIIENPNYRDANFSQIAPRFKTGSYFITITPVQGEVDNNLEDRAESNVGGYVSVQSSQSNQNFFSTEIDWTKTTSSKIVIKNTGRNIPKYISYYANGTSMNY